jgi:RNA polymerase sigma-70 factor, ECF subfamily
MRTGAHRRTESEVRAHLEGGSVGGASRLCLEAYGAELFGLLLGVLEDAAVARRIYADVASQIASEIGDFHWRCSLRSWTYSLAHRKLADRRRHLSGAGDDREGDSVRVPIDTEPERSRDLESLQWELSEEDRELLILRIDRALPWSELCVISLGAGVIAEGGSPEALEREEERLRRRVDHIVRGIERSAVERRLLPPKPPA